MGRFGEKFTSFFNNRWLVFVAAMWVQSCGGIGYVFGSISPVIKSSLSYNQRQVASLGVAKDLGDSVGFLPGILSDFLPLWGVLLIGAIQNLIGYGWVWLVVTGRTPVLPLWAVSIPFLVKILQLFDPLTFILLIILIEIVFVCVCVCVELVCASVFQFKILLPLFLAAFGLMFVPHP